MSVDNKIVQGLWIGNKLSLLEQLSLKSFMANGHEYHLYIYDDVENIPEGTIWFLAKEIFMSFKDKTKLVHYNSNGDFKCQKKNLEY